MNRRKLFKSFLGVVITLFVPKAVSAIEPQPTVTYSVQRDVIVAVERVNKEDMVYVVPVTKSVPY